MNEQIERTILETEYRSFVATIRQSGGAGLPDTSPKQDGTLDHLSIHDLREIVRELRDLVRSSGGMKGGA